MSLAWATVVVVVLLLPGFAFFFGFYLPEQVTREATPISPLGQLAIVVGLSFLVHACSYIVINSFLCKSEILGIRCVALDQFIPLLRIDSLPAAPRLGDRPETLAAIRGTLGESGRMVDENAVQITAYFVAVTSIGVLLGLLAGMVMQLSSMQRFARHRWMYSLNEGRRHAWGSKKARRIKAKVLSKTSEAGAVLIYSGVVEDFFAKTDGTISQLVLRYPQKGHIKVGEAGGAENINMVDLPVDGKEVGRSFLFLTSDDIANVFFVAEPVVEATSQEMDRLRKLKEAKDKVASGDAPSGLGGAGPQ
ncbi:hypothetical protein [Variovorax saccharolyticus]|uniref:hypothetical protein n=1 Tax=Variovorax saccharolyticus TaxID=3053516 RepID=UPI0025771F0B|nr:hypothetical protein [Variovorax sp. J31P216]MDM0025911.1 hypothetical protein [Variovorax sp. J31P216]